LKAYRSIKEMQGPIDCAIPCLMVEELLPHMQDQIRALARSHGIRVIGPNCTGFWNVAPKEALTFVSTAPKEVVSGCNIGIIFQGGGSALDLMVMDGLGSVTDQLLKHVQWSALPLSAQHAIAMGRKLNTSPPLNSFRGRTRADVAALAAAVARLSEIAVANPDSTSAEVVLLVVSDEGRGTVALDAVFVSKKRMALEAKGGMYCESERTKTKRPASTQRHQEPRRPSGNRCRWMVTRACGTLWQAGEDSRTLLRRGIGRRVRAGTRKSLGSQPGNARDRGKSTWRRRPSGL
jgi:hypothetical protein